MAFGRWLFIDWYRKRRIRSLKSGSPDVVDRITFAKAETYPFIVQLVEPDPDVPGPNKYRVSDIANLSLKMCIHESPNTPAPHVEQTTWTKDTSAGTFSGNLNLSTGAMNTYMSVDREPYFEVAILGSGGEWVKVLVELCSVVMGVAQATTTAPDAVHHYITLEEGSGIWMSKRGGAGETITLVSPDGTHERILGMKDDGTPQDDYA